MLDEGQKNNLHSIIERDCQFLQDSHLIDYSLLIGEISVPVNQVRSMVRRDPSLATGLHFSSDGTKAYLVGIIDPLTKFTGRKEAEYQLKRIKSGNSMSCVPPEEYAARFCRAMR